MILTNYAIKFRTAVFVFIVVLIAAGVTAYVRLPREGSPDITIPFVFMSAYYEGTAPEEMEKLITIPLEKQLNDIENIKEMRSTSAENLTTLTIEFLAGQDIDLALQRVKDKVDLAKPDLPEDLDEPVVQAFNFSSDAPVFIFALAGNTELSRLKKMAELLQDQIEQISGVKEAAISGTREREIRVEIDLPRLVSYGIPIPLLMQRIAAENTTVSAGNLEMRGDKFQVRIPGEFTLASELEDILLDERGGKPIYLTDVAKVADTFKDVETISRLNGKPSVSITIKKRSGENTVALIDRVREVLTAFTLPPGMTLNVVLDESDYVHMMLRELENNIFTGFLLVIVVLVLFMGGRNSFFVALAIPFSMLIAFALISALGFTLNMIVLFSLVLAVGMLVDNAIVIVENIYRYRTQGLTRIEAARRGASEVAWPVVTSTLTTCAAFSPLLFWPDVMGQFMGFMPRTLIVVLTASLFVALVINPAVCSALISSGKSKRDRKETSGHHPFVAGYERILRGALRVRLPVMLLGFATLVLTVQMYVRFGKGVELFPDVDPRNAKVEIKYPQGTSIERTDAALKAVESKLLEYGDIEFFLTTVGGSSGLAWTATGGGAHYGMIHVEFPDFLERKVKSSVLIEQIRKDVGDIPGAEVKVEKQEEGPPTGAPVSIEISGEDFETLARLSSEVIQTIKTVPGLVDVQDDYEQALPELQFRVDRKRAALLGLNTWDIGLFLRTAIYGLETSKFRADEDEYDITVRLPENQRNSVALLDRIYIPTPAGTTVPLSSLGSVVYTGGRGSINRKDQNRVITITGSDEGRGVDKIIADVQQRLQKLNLPKGYAIDYAGDTEEMRQSGAFLGRAFGIAVGLILVVLVIQFNSALLPLIIICSVVLSLIGVMWGLLICGMRFGVIMTGVGVISLAGIVVNNAIVLVDCIRRREASGMDVTEAIVYGGRTRLRPVLLTAITTILGLIPMAVGYSLQIHDWPWGITKGAESSQWWAPMAVAVIFGLGVATVLTLILVPVMYSLSASFAAFLRHRFSMPD